MMKFYADMFGAIPGIDENFYPMVAKAQELGKPVESVPRIYHRDDSDPMKKRYDAIKTNRQIVSDKLVKAPQDEGLLKKKAIYEKAFAIVDAWRKAYLKFDDGVDGKVTDVRMKVPEGIGKASSAVEDVKAAGGAGTIVLVKGTNGYNVSGDTLKQVPGRPGKKAYEVIKDVAGSYARWDKYNKAWNVSGVKVDEVKKKLAEYGFNIVER
jgi:hypothetical protein